MKKCKIDNNECSKSGRLELGLCRKHYIRLWKYGDPHYTKIKRHGYKKHPWAATYYGIMARCYNKNFPSYKYYGGRGIRMMKAMHDIKVFCDYMSHRFGEKPPKGYSLDRIDNDGHYVPYNIRLATKKEQMRNTRSVCQIKCIETGEIFNSQVEAGEKMGLCSSAINLVLNNKRNHTGGYTFEYV